MNYTDRLKRLGWCFALLGMMILGAAGYRMLLQKDALVHRIYLDTPMQRVFQELAADQIILPADDGVSIELNHLRERIDNPGLRQFIVDRQRYLSFDNDRLIIQPEALTVQNRRIVKRLSAGRRGRILDRHGRPLALSAAGPQGGVVRRYPLGKAGFPLLGVAHPVYGLKGLEAELDGYLQGAAREGLLKGGLRFLTGKTPLRDVVLTIDAELQRKAFDALGDNTGAVVLMDVANGDILAAASAPAFDPATPVGSAWDMEADKGRSSGFVNRAVARRYPPGSTFKLVTAAAWMESPDFDPTWRVNCTGRNRRYGIGDYKGHRHGWMNLDNATALSCNVYFAELGVKLGPQLAEMAARFGFNARWPLAGLPAADAGFMLPSRAFRGHTGVADGGDWKPSDFARNPKLVAQAAIGQNLIEATPLQMAMVAAAIGNGGRLMAPRLVERIQYMAADGDSEGSWITDQTMAIQLLRETCSGGTSRDLIGMMREVMQKGTGHRIPKIYFHDGSYRAGHRLPDGAGNVLAGKTGTAQSGRGRKDHAWFVGVAPADDPKFAVCAVVEHGGLGAGTAGPIAVAVMHAALNGVHE